MEAAGIHFRMRYVLPVSLASAVALAVLGSILWQRQPAAAPSSSAAPERRGSGAPDLPVDTYLVAAEPLRVEVQATGTLLAREFVELVSELERRLVRVRAAEGSVVRKGSVLFELDSADLRAQLAKLDVETTLEKTTLERRRKLFADGLTPQQEVETAQAAYDSLLAQRRVLEVTLSKTEIRAPFAGRLGLRRVSEGAWLSPNTVLATLQDTTALKLDFTLPERYAGAVRVGSEFEFTVAGRGDVFRGTVSAAEPAVEPTTRSIVVRGAVERPDALLPGTFATVKVPIHLGEAMLIPAIAVVPGVDGRRVFVARDGEARAVRVDVGARDADRVQVLSGVRPGDRVIISNLLRVRDGARVRVLSDATASSAPTSLSSAIPRNAVARSTRGEP